MEEWRKIKGSENAYISSEGRVKVNGEIREGKTKGGHGYLRVSIPKVRQRYVHRLVLEAFKEQPIGKTFANHINGNKHDNRVENLEWSTNRENLLLAGRDGRLVSHGHKTPVRAVMPDGSERTFESQTEAAKALGIKNCNIAKCLTGDRRTTHGMKFAYCDIQDVETNQMSIFDYIGREQK